MGDYASCQSQTINGQYVLATVTGGYEGEYPFPRGVFGKSIPFSTQVGLCVPLQCDVMAVSAAWTPLLQRYASEASWVNPTVSYEYSSNYSHEVSHKLTVGKGIALICVGLVLSFVLYATLVQLSKMGDRVGLQPKRQLDNTAQYENQVISRKMRWAQWLTAFSVARSFNNLN